MGCGASTEAAPPAQQKQHYSNGGGGGTTPMAKNPYATTAPGSKSKGDDPQESYKNANIDRDIDHPPSKGGLRVRFPPFEGGLGGI